MPTPSSHEPAANERWVPATRMGDRYLEVHAEAEPPRKWKRGERTAHQRSLAERDLEEVASVDDDFVESVTQFEAYQPRDQPFYEARKPEALKRWLGPGKPNTS